MTRRRLVPQGAHVKPFGAGDPMRFPFLLVALYLSGSCVACCAQAALPSPVAAMRLLGSSDAGERRRGAEELARGDGPPAEAVPALYAAIREEQSPKVYGALLVALGSAGIAEARPLIDARIDDPDSDARGYAREALRRWLVRNMLLSEGEELPPPPHRLYGPTSALPPGAPGAKPTPELRDPLDPER